MIEKGKIPVVVVSFNLRNPEEGPFASLRTPFYDQEVGDFVVVSDGNPNPIPRIAIVQQVDWRKPPYNSFHSPACILTYLNVKQLLKDSMESQKEAYEEAVQYTNRKRQRKEEIEATLRELRKEIFKLGRELDTL